MILSTTEFVPDRQIDKILGIARGSTVRSRNVARILLHNLKILLEVRLKNIQNCKPTQESRHWRDWLLMQISLMPMRY